jgi:uncharacterized protein YjbI with pentapeptide repeats
VKLSLSALGSPIISLQGADLSGANLEKAKLSGADLREADLRGAIYDDETKFSNGFAPIESGMKKRT